MKSYTYLILFVWALSHQAHSQCESVTARSVTDYTPLAIDSLFESDGLRDGPDYTDATLYFPKSLDKTYKSIVFVPGYFATQASVKHWARYLASRGFVSMTIGTVRLWDQPNLRASALIDGMETIRQENDRMDSPLYQMLDTGNIAVGGWSMGGGGAQLAAAMEPRVKSVIAIAPWLNENSLSPADLDHSAPILIISGQSDPTAQPARHADVHYDYTPASTDKMIFEITDGDHSTPLFPSTGNGSVGNVGFAWLNLFLEDDDCYCEMLRTDSLNQNATASKYLTNINCIITSTDLSETTKLNVAIFPNPTSDYFTTEFAYDKPNGYIIYNLYGQRVKSGMTNTGDKINIATLPSGTYWLKIQQEILKVIKR